MQMRHNEAVRSGVSPIVWLVLYGLRLMAHHLSACKEASTVPHPGRVVGLTSQSLNSGPLSDFGNVKRGALNGRDTISPGCFLLRRVNKELM